MTNTDISLAVGDLIFVKKFRLKAEDGQSFMELSAPRNKELAAIALTGAGTKDPIDQNKIMATLLRAGFMRYDSIEKVVGPELTQDIQNAIIEEIENARD